MPDINNILNKNLSIVNIANQEIFDKNKTIKQNNQTINPAENIWSDKIVWVVVIIKIK